MTFNRKAITIQSAADAAVHLVEDDGAHGLDPGQNVFHGQNHPGQLTARSHALEWLGNLPGVR